MSNNGATNSANSQTSSCTHVQTTIILLLLLYRLATIRLLLMLVITTVALRRRGLLVTAILLLGLSAISIVGGTTTTVASSISTVTASAILLRGSRIRTIAVAAGLLLTTGSEAGPLKTGGFPLRAAGGLFNVIPSLILVVPLRVPARRKGRLVGGRVVRRRWPGSVARNAGRGSVAWLLGRVLSLVAGLLGRRVFVAAAVVGRLLGLSLRRLRGIGLLRRLLLRRGIVIARSWWTE